MARIDYTASEDAVLLSLIGKIHPTASKNSLRKMIDSGRVLLDDEICRVAKFQVTEGQKITILPKKDGDPPRKLKRNLAKDPDILYEDQYVIVVDCYPYQLIQEMKKTPCILEFSNGLRVEKKEEYSLYIV